MHPNKTLGSALWLGWVPGPPVGQSRTQPQLCYLCVPRVTTGESALYVMQKGWCEQGWMSKNEHPRQ